MLSGYFSLARGDPTPVAAAAAHTALGQPFSHSNRAVNQTLTLNGAKFVSAPPPGDLRR